jgi:type IV pilus assembly protein PilA
VTKIVSFWKKATFLKMAHCLLYTVHGRTSAVLGGEKMKAVQIRQQVQRGFTLIELMIVVAIIGILASISIPQYQDYVVRSKLSATVAGVASLQTAVSEMYQTDGTFPDSTALGSAGIGITAPKGTSVAVGANGVITITLSTVLGSGFTNASALILTPTAAAVSGNAASAIKWTASHSNITSKVGLNWIAKFNS